MEIKVRYLRKDIVKKIDSISAAEGYKSRNEFLAKKLEDIAFKNEGTKLEKDYLSLMNSLIEATQNHTRVLSSFMDQFAIDADKAYNLNLNYNGIRKDIKKEVNNYTLEKIHQSLL